MQSTLECLPCFLKQAIHAARLSTDSNRRQQKILAAVARLLANMDLQLSPPENSMAVYETISRLSGCADPFAHLKEQSNTFAADFLAASTPLIRQSDDPLFTALLFSIAGNIIDYGAQQDFDAQSVLDQCLATPLAINHYQQLRQAFHKSHSILYLADNAGEIVFDKLVIETMLALDPDKEITVAVKDGPIINDATLADARQIGLPALGRVISNGVVCPGTPVSRCSAEFRQLFSQADLIISKGQGNFETLSLVKAPIFFLLTVKCAIVASHLLELTGTEVELGDLLLIAAAQNPIP